MAYGRADPEPGKRGRELAREGGEHFVAGSVSLPSESLPPRIETLRAMVQRHDVAGIVKTLQALVPTYPRPTMVHDVATAGGSAEVRNRGGPTRGAIYCSAMILVPSKSNRKRTSSSPAARIACRSRRFSSL